MKHYSFGHLIISSLSAKIHFECYHPDEAKTNIPLGRINHTTLFCGYICINSKIISLWDCESFKNNDFLFHLSLQ